MAVSSTTTATQNTTHPMGEPYARGQARKPFSVV